MKGHPDASKFSVAREYSERISNPIYTADGIFHCCVANMPGVVPKTSTLALINAALPCAVEIARKGWMRRAMRENEEIKRGTNIVKERQVACK